MRENIKKLGLVLILALAFSPFVGVHKAAAQEGLEALGGASTYTDSAGNVIDSATGKIVDVGGSTSGDIGPGSVPPPVVSENSNSPGKEAANQSGNNTGPKPVGCIQLSLTSLSVFNLEGCVALAMNLIMWLVSWILFLAGLFLDASLYFTIHLSDVMKTVPVVEIGWRIFRDLANIFFIFILLWIALSTILGFNSGKTKELLVHLIVVALLINFSLFITKAVVDASNIVALHFYGLITGGGAKTLTIPGSFSGAFMDGLKIQTLYDPPSAGGGALSRLGTVATGLAVGGPGGALLGLISTGGNLLNMAKIILIGVFGSILMITAAYVFLVAAMLFIVRIVVLMMVMILSPLAFLAYALPAGEKYMEKWRESLINQSMFAPIYLALSYVVVKAIQTPAFQTAMSVTSGTMSTGTNSFMPLVGIIVNFFILIFLMLGCIIIAKKMEAYGHETAIELGKAARGFVYRSIVRGTYVSPVLSVANRLGLGGVGKATGELMQKYLPGTKQIPGLGRFGKTPDFQKMGESLVKGSKAISDIHGREKIQKAFDINEWDKSFKKTAFGRTELGDFLREKTVGGKYFGTKATFGGEKSVHEAYEESEKLRQLREDTRNKEQVKQNLDRLKVAEREAKRYTRPKREDFTDEHGNLDEVGFEEAELAFTQTLKTTIERPKLADFATTADYETARDAYLQIMQRLDLAQPKRENFLTQNEFNFALEAYEGRLDPPKVADFPEDTAAFEAAQKLYGSNLEKRRKAAETEAKSAKAALGTSMNFLSAQGFAELSEHDIEELAPYADVKKQDAVLDSKEYTLEEKKQMLRPAYESYVKGFMQLQKEFEKYEEKLQRYSKLIKDGLIEIDSLGNAATIDVRDGKRYAKRKDGNWEEIPDEPEASSELRNWARNDMTKRKYEILSLVMPDAYNVETLVSTIRWPMIFKELRTSDFMSYSTRDNNTYAKDWKLYKRIMKMEENSEEERRAAWKAAEEAARAARAGKSGAEADKAAREAYEKTYANLTIKDTLKRNELYKWMSDRSPDEIAGTRGTGRNSPILHSGLDGGGLAKWDGKDLADIIIALQDLLTAFAKDRMKLQPMTAKNKNALRWLIEQTAGKRFARPPLGNVEVEVGKKPDGKPETQTVSLDAILKELDDKGEVEFASDHAARGAEPGQQRERGRGQGADEDED